MILALDIGTSSVRAALYDYAAEPIPGASVKIERSLTATADGGAEIDADEAFSQVCAGIDAVLEKTSELNGEIAYLATSSFWHSLVGVDKNGRPTTKVFGWADTRSREYTEVLRKKFDESIVHNRTGAHFHSSFWPAKLLWLRRDYPEVFAATAKWLSFSDYVAFRLSGEAVTSVSMASGSGIFDIRTCDWDSELLKYLDIKPSHLPGLTGNDSDTFHLNEGFSVRWPRLAKTEWFPAIADGAADNIGAGCVSASEAALMVGTSAAMRVAYTGNPPAEIPNGLWCYRIDRKQVIVGGALSNGGNLYAWLKRNLRLPADAEEQIAHRKPGSHNLIFLPYLAGERSVGYRENAVGLIDGITTKTEAVDILHAALESVALQLADIYERLSSIFEIKQVVASGGALRESPLWRKIISETLRRSLTINDVPESSSRGAVLLALESDGKI